MFCNLSQSENNLCNIIFISFFFRYYLPVFFFIKAAFLIDLLFFAGKIQTGTIVNSLIL